MKELIKKLLRETLLKTPYQGQNILFHSTDFYKATHILNDNEIAPNTRQGIRTKLNPDTNQNVSDKDSKSYRGVSLTRDGSLKFSDVQFILDGDLIKRDYGKNLVPFDFFSRVSGAKPKHSSERNDMVESEEFLVGPLKNVRKYIVGIRIYRVYRTLKNFYEEDREAYWRLKEAIGRIPIYDENNKPIEL